MKAPELKERLEESEKLIQEMTVTWEQKLRKTEEIAQVICTFFFVWLFILFVFKHFAGHLRLWLSQHNLKETCA